MLTRRIIHGIMKNNLMKGCSCNIQYSVRMRDMSTKKDAEESNTVKLTSLGEIRTDESNSSKMNPSGAGITSKYKVFQDEDSEIILDLYEERLKYSNLLEEEEQDDSPYDGLNYERGKSGVFEIEDLVDVLKRENAIDIFVAKVPNEIKYVNFICIVSGKSQRHMQAIAQFVRRVYKMKRHQGDIIPKLEGENSKDWMALDLGNIALHIFSMEARIVYDLDSLWALGSEYDNEFNKPEPVSEMLELHSVYLSEYQPAS
ncbi:unnamed protein product [Phaedon cochleariae]|uniref:Mitochondrial assembly of ribosomal large subunit protein 1 n=1 Tax=Phaedon cochleariae TaxID=80249 RepID=A0A9P0GHZ0_PHACE|nr:unnamed protein product [Phaedon cochleariae]